MHLYETRGTVRRGFVAQLRYADCLAIGAGKLLPVAAVFDQQRRTSATLHAWATQPRGVKGLSASQISLIDPMQASPR